MPLQKHIAVKEFCKYHNIRVEFILELQQHELIEIVTIKRTGFIPSKYLPDLEKAPGVVQPG